MKDALKRGPRWRWRICRRRRPPVRAAAAISRTHRDPNGRGRGGAYWSAVERAPRLARPPNRPSLAGSQPTRVSQRARLLLQAEAYPGVSTASWSGAADATPHRIPAIFLPLSVATSALFPASTGTSRHPLNGVSCCACTWPHRLSCGHRIAKAHSRHLRAAAGTGRPDHDLSALLTRRACAAGVGLALPSNRAKALCEEGS